MNENDATQTEDHVEEAVPHSEIATTVSDMPTDFGDPGVADFPDAAFGEVATPKDDDDDEDGTPGIDEPDPDDDEEPEEPEDGGSEPDQDVEEEEPVLPPDEGDDES